MSGEASESISSTDLVFGTDLFEETMATESTITEPAMEGVGAKIWGAIKSVFNAIANFFKNLFKKSTTVQSKLQQNSSSSSSNGSSSVQKEKTETKEERKIRRDAEEKKEQEEFDRKAKERKERAEAQKKFEEEQKKANEEREAQQRRRNIENCHNQALKLEHEIFDKTYKLMQMISKCNDMAASSAFTGVIYNVTLILKSMRDDNVDADNIKEVARSEYRKYNNIAKDQTEMSLDKDLSELHKVRGSMQGIIESISDEYEYLKSYCEKVASSFESDWAGAPGIDEQSLKISAFRIRKGRVGYNLSEKVNKISLNMIKRIQDACNKNSEFCKKMIKACEPHSKELTPEGHQIYDLCKVYLDITKRYNLLTQMFFNITSRFEIQTEVKEKKSKWEDESYWYSH